MEDYSNSATSNLKKPVLIVFGITLVLFIIATIVFFIFNTIVFVSVTNNSGNTSVATTAVTTTKTASVGGTGLLIVPRDTHSLIITAGDYAKTQTILNLPWFGFASASVQLDADQNADKVAYAGAAPTCATYDKSSDALLNYNCQSPTDLIRYQTPASGSWANQSVASLSYISNQYLPPYLDGVLGATSNTVNSTTLSITATASGKKTTYDAPSGINAQNAVGMRIFTDANNPTNSHFVLADARGTVYLATVQNGKAAYKIVSAPNNYSYVYNQTFCSINGETADCFRGRTPVNVPAGTTVADTTVDQLSFTDGLTNSKKVSAAPILDAFYLTTTGKLYGKSGTALYSLTAAGDNYTAKPLAAVPDSAAAGDKLYFVQTNGVYTIDDTTGDAHQVFYSPNITVLGVYPVDGKVFIFGTALNGGAAIYAYKLNATTDTTPGKRLIDVLPLSSADTQNVAAQDFIGDKVVVQVSGNTTDPNTVKSNFLSALTGKGVTLPDGNLTIIK